MIEKTEALSASAEVPRGLAKLPTVVLDARRRAMLDHAAAAARGDTIWLARKPQEARDLLGLSQIAPAGRLEIQHLDLEDDLRALLVMRVPVPCLPDPGGDLVVEEYAVLGLTVPQKSLALPMPGSAFLQILMPLYVWHPNVSPGFGQRLCLGAQLPAGIRAKEIVLLAFSLLAMQNATIDERDAAGVMNREAALWWQANGARIPLTRTPFLGIEPERCAVADEARGNGRDA